MGPLELNGPFRIGGSDFSRDELLEECRCRTEAEGSGTWEGKLYRFILSLLEPGTGPILQPTSGTTGDPRVHELGRDAMVASARRTIAFFKLKPGERCLLCLPVDYIAGKMMVVRALAGGLDLVAVEPSSRPLEGTTGKFGLCAMVPLQVHESLKAGGDLSATGNLLVGGGEIHSALRSRLEQLAAPAVYESFGMTETCSHFALCRVNGPNPDPSFRLMDGVDAATDPRGCLVVNIPGITNGSVVTNDLVELNPGADGFRWLGRADNVISTGGIKVIPELLEHTIRSLLHADCLLVAVPDEKLGQKMVLVVEWPHPAPDTKGWELLLRQHLAPHEVPGRIVTLENLPRNASMKPDRRAARERISLL
jgi:O-succinylbenzoic acid--CoA ligase